MIIYISHCIYRFSEYIIIAHDIITRITSKITKHRTVNTGDRVPEEQGLRRSVLSNTFRSLSCEGLGARNATLVPIFALVLVFVMLEKRLVTWIKRPRQIYVCVILSCLPFAF